MQKVSLEELLSDLKVMFKDNQEEVDRMGVENQKLKENAQQLRVPHGQEE